MNKEICKICRREINDYNYTGIQMPYGSKYDGEFICNYCLIQIIDPLMERIDKEEKEENK